MEEELDNLRRLYRPTCVDKNQRTTGDKNNDPDYFRRRFSDGVLSTDSARANSLNAERLLGMMAALEARVAALETKNREYKRELAAYWTCAALAWSSARLHPAGALLARDYLRLGCTLPVVK